MIRMCVGNLDWLEGVRKSACMEALDAWERRQEKKKRLLMYNDLNLNIAGEHERRQEDHQKEQLQILANIKKACLSWDDYFYDDLARPSRDQLGKTGNTVLMNHLSRKTGLDYETFRPVMILGEAVRAILAFRNAESPMAKLR